MLDPKENILIVDDEQVIRGLLGRKLSKDGYRCEVSDSAENALVKLEARPFELVISDIRMAGKTGIDLMVKIKELHPDTAVIMATAVNEISTAILCLTQGADDYIVKPFDLDQVLLSVRTSLAKRRLRLDLKEYQCNLEEKIKRQTLEIQGLSVAAIEALIVALEAKDKYTAGHSRRVTEMAVSLGNGLRLGVDEIENLRLGSLLHDVGKIGVDQAVQNKPGGLTKEEYEHIMIHSCVGADIIRSVVNRKVVEIVAHHHDRYDGLGLGQILRGQDIPLGARIVAVADTFDAMTSDRPYRQALPLNEALREIERCSGTQFDPDVVQVFLRQFVR